MFIEKDLIKNWKTITKNEKKVIIEQLSKTNQIFNDWYKLYINTQWEEKEIITLIQEQLLLSAKNFEDWIGIFLVSPKESDFEKIALSKMIESAEKFEEWCEIIICTEKEEIKLFALKKLEKLASNLCNWNEIISSNFGGSVRIFAYLSNTKEDNLRKISLRKIEKTTANFFEWTEVLTSTKDYEFKKAVLQKMAENYDNDNHWKVIANLYGKNPDIKNISILKNKDSFEEKLKILEKATSFEEKLRICRLYHIKK
jgi:hypothetical protein